MKQKKQTNKSVLGVDVSRRRIMQWSVPTLAIVSLPAHAQCSEGLDENAMPVVTADVKCTLNQASGMFEGESTIVISSTGGPISINTLSVTGLGPNDSVNLPNNLPVIVSSASPLQITWQGQSADGVTCVPVNDFDIDMTYGCTNVATNTFSVNILELLT